MTMHSELKHSLRVFVPLCAVTFLLLAAPVRAAERPNVIVIMADDIGAEGLACYGSTIYTTPHLDRMAAEGIRFKNAYATPLCTPTRVMIMSGLYPNRTGYRALMGNGEGVRLVPEIRTFAHDFRDAGYATAIAGKWQLGKFDEYPDQPVEHGFDEYCMWTWYYKGKKSSRYYGPQIYREGKVTDGDAEDFGPDDYRDFVLDFIDRKKDQPFLVYFPMALVHSPFVNPPDLQKRSESRFTSDLDKKTRAFGHMITYMDQVVGDIMAKLKEHGLERNTLVLFTGDNGTHKSITSKLPGMDLKGGKGSMTEAGSRVPLLAWWSGHCEAGRSRRILLPCRCPAHDSFRRRHRAEPQCRRNGSFSSSHRRRRNDAQTGADQLRPRLLRPGETLPTESGRQTVRHPDHLRRIAIQ